MKKIKLWLLALKIEWHWWFILQIRRKGNSLIRGGFPLTSQKLYKLTESFTLITQKHLKLNRCTACFQNLINMRITKGSEEPFLFCFSSII